MFALIGFISLLSFAAWSVLVILTIVIGLAVVVAVVHSPFNNDVYQSYVDIITAIWCAWLVMFVVGLVSLVIYMSMSYLMDIPMVDIWLL